MAINKRIYFKDVASSEGVENYANQQLQKVIEFLEKERQPVSISLTFAPSKVHAHNRVELMVHSPEFDRITTDEGPAFYKVLDHVIDTMYRELHEDKQRRVDSLRRQPKHNSEPEE